MVIKSKIYDFLKKNLGEYLYGFQKNQLDVGLLSGHIDLVNVNFRPDKVNQLLGTLGLPITIKAGLMGKLRLKCHYTSFLSSPIEVEIDELLLVFGPITHLARESKNLIEDETDDAILQMELEQKIINSNKSKHRRHSKRKETPIAYDDDTPRVYKNMNNQQSFKTEKLSRSGNVSQAPSEDEASKHRKKHTSRGSIKESEGMDSTVLKSDIELNRKNLENNNQKKFHKEKEERSTPVVTIKDKSYDSISSRKPPRYQYVEVGVQAQKKEGILEKYFSKVLKNLILTIKDVHIRYEDETYPYKNPFSIGISLSKLEVKNISHEWVYTDSKPTKRSPRKNAIIKDITFSNFAMYIYSMASVLIPTSLWEATIHSEIGIFEAFPAYEVRDLIIQESTTLSKSHQSTFINPTNISLCVSFYEEAPTLRIAGLIEKVSIKFSAAMAECVRNFFDYCTNVQIWPLVLRYRPYVKIPERPEGKEKRRDRKKRREIVKQWFKYAFAFVKTKRAAIKYVKERKKDNELFKKLEKQEKIREKVAMQTPKEVKEFRGRSEPLSPIEQKPSLFSFAQKKKTPETSGIKLSEYVKEYNTKKPIMQQLQRRPYDGDIYFPKSLVNSEIELNINTLHLSILDEDTQISLEIEAYDLGLISNTLLDEMKSIISIGSYIIKIQEQGNSSEIIRAGKKKNQNDARNGNTNDQLAVKITKIYRPGEILIPNDIYLSMNMFEVNTILSPVIITYNHKVLNHFFLIKEAIELDKCFRENLDMRYVKAFTKHCRKHKMPQVFGVDFKKYVLCKSIANKFVDIQKQAENYIHELHANISHIMFDVSFEIQGGVVNFHDFSPNSLMSVNLASNKFTFCKDKMLTSVSAFGFIIQSSNTPVPLYEFITTVGSIFLERINQFNVFYRYKH
ncbi:hypothetical protein SteCoe_33633 [Stentor coeruleus]|uniref:Chorein N-terminal domain-containing protein n=1 Tax=Stentor coeruleus TaxID=5963 RepID=A0A1R2AWG4_9CILI|nr:hypothetical protein SteCoe_33633 [Stentor coeruleus]